MSHQISLKELHEWCSVKAKDLPNHPKKRVPFRLVKDRVEMGEVMARDLADEIKKQNKKSESTRAIIPCGPKGWYEPFARIVNAEKISLKRLTVFHMDECLDWQGQLLPKNHPCNFRTFMEQYFYAPISPDLSVPVPQRFWLTPGSAKRVREEIQKAPVHITLGGWGQDGHVAYNQARRSPYSAISLDELRKASVRIQENNWDTVLAMANRSFGTAYQFVPPMSITLGVKECLSAKKIRVYSDTGAWKQTALRVALFSPPTVEYPFTLLQEHADAQLTATQETADHPFAENPDWDFFGASGYHED